MKAQGQYWKRGQNTAEYLIMLTLVAVATIGLFTVVGKTLRNKVAVVTAAIAGESQNFEDAKSAVSKASAEAFKRGGAKVEMKGQAKEELDSGE